MRHDDSITSGLAMSGVFVAVCNGCNFHITSHQSPVITSLINLRCCNGEVRVSLIVFDGMVHFTLPSGVVRQSSNLYCKDN